MYSFQFCSIQTSKRFAGSETNDFVQVKITGETENETVWYTLNRLWVNDFEAGSTQTYTVNHFGPEIGAPVILHFREWLFHIARKSVKNYWQFM